jgi:hypothetical protein
VAATQSQDERNSGPSAGRSMMHLTVISPVITNVSLKGYVSNEKIVVSSCAETSEYTLPNWSQTGTTLTHSVWKRVGEQYCQIWIRELWKHLINCTFYNGRDKSATEDNEKRREHGCNHATFTIHDAPPLRRRGPRIRHLTCSKRVRPSKDEHRDPNQKLPSRHAKHHAWHNFKDRLPPS